MFFGEPVNVARYDQQKHVVFENLIEKQISFFWRPEEVDLSKDKRDFLNLAPHEQHIFLSNLKYQTLLDSVQGRSPNVALLPVVSLPELETWIETWSFFETIHSRSYTHIIRNVFPNPSEILGGIVEVPEIVARARAITKYYDKFIDLSSKYNMGMDVDIYELKKTLYLLLVAINILEGIRFYASFACSFSFAERKLMEGNAKLIKLIARDEATHLAGTQQMIKILSTGKDDPDFVKIARECEVEVIKMFRETAQQEMDWAEYLFQDGSMVGLSKGILVQYIEFITDQRMKAIGIKPLYNRTSNPLPWMANWLNSDNVQVAPQETEISSYLVGAIDSTVDTNDFGGMEL